MDKVFNGKEIKYEFRFSIWKKPSLVEYAKVIDDLYLCEFIEYQVVVHAEYIYAINVKFSKVNDLIEFAKLNKLVVYKTYILSDNSVVIFC